MQLYLSEITRLKWHYRSTVAVLLHTAVRVNPLKERPFDCALQENTIWRLLRVTDIRSPQQQKYLSAAESSVFRGYAVCLVKS